VAWRVDGNVIGGSQPAGRQFGAYAGAPTAMGISGFDGPLPSSLADLRRLTVALARKRETVLQPVHTNSRLAIAATLWTAGLVSPE
jgi:hypothetical protein